MIPFHVSTLLLSFSVFLMLRLSVLCLVHDIKGNKFPKIVLVNFRIRPHLVVYSVSPNGDQPPASLSPLNSHANKSLL